jgi:hypothetical protein
VPNSVTSRDEEQEHRPGAVLFVYTLDLVVAILALFETLAPFAGGVQTSTGVKALPLAVQVIFAVSTASYAATLIIVAALLTRRQAWVRTTQIGTLGIAIALAAISNLVLAVSGNSGGLPALLGTLIFVLLAAFAILIMTERRVVSWYVESAPIPVYVWATLALWVAGSGVNIVLDVVFH